MKVPTIRGIPDLLLQFGIPAHRVGFKYLCIALADYQKDCPPFFTKELYPAIAKKAGTSDWRSVEHGIRQAIIAGWKRGNKEFWNVYFPGSKRPPTSKRFIATIAEYM
jgi:hypothetical protein